MPVERPSRKKRDDQTRSRLLAARSCRPPLGPKRAALNGPRGSVQSGIIKRRVVRVRTGEREARSKPRSRYAARDERADQSGPEGGLEDWARVRPARGATGRRGEFESGQAAMKRNFSPRIRSATASISCSRISAADFIEIARFKMRRSKKNSGLAIPTAGSR